MRRLPPVNKKILFSALSVLDLSVRGTAMGTAYLHTLQFNRGCEVTPIVPATRSARLFRLTSIRTRAFAARFQLESVVRALPSFRRSQSADRFELSTNRIEAVAQSPGRGGKTRGLWQRSYQGISS